MALTVVQPGVGGTGNANLTFPNTTGTVMVSGNMPTFCVSLSANQTISNSTWTKCQLNTKQWDTGTYFDATTNYRYTPLIAGYYQINWGFGGGTSNNNAFQVLGAIYKNGSVYTQSGFVTPSGNIQGFNVNPAQVIYMNGSTDYLEFYGFVYASNGTQTIGGGSFPGSTMASGCLVRTA